MNIEIRPLSEHIGAEIINAEAKDFVGEATTLKDLLHKYQVLLLRNQSLSPANLISFASQFGEIVPFLLSNYHHPEHKEILVSSNVKVDGKNIGVSRVGNFWHSDSSYIEQPPNTTILYSIQIPPSGGDTVFSNMYKAYKDLDLATKELLAGRTALHTIRKRYRITEKDVGLSVAELDEELKKRHTDVAHPVFRKHPLTGRTALFVSDGYTLRINGLDVLQNEKVLGMLNNLSTREQVIYRHKWQVGDLILWDNPSVNHAVTASDPEIPRTMWRITVQ
jgi:taurine dioxygenase